MRSKSELKRVYCSPYHYVSLSRAPSTCRVHRVRSPVSCSSFGCQRLEIGAENALVGHIGYHVAQGAESPEIRKVANFKLMEELSLMMKEGGKVRAPSPSFILSNVV